MQYKKKALVFQWFLQLNLYTNINAIEYIMDLKIWNTCIYQSNITDAYINTENVSVQ